MNEIAQKLQAPFVAEDYEFRVQSESFKGDKVNVLCYVTARAIQNRLDEVFGPFGWSTKYSVGPGGGVICELSCKEQGKGEWVSKQDGAENTDIEAVKGGLSGAIKRAGSAWGIGRLLYNLESTWVDLKNKGKHYHKLKKPKGDVKYMFWDEPALPDWAVAGGNKKPAAKKTPPKKTAGKTIRTPGKVNDVDHRKAFGEILAKVRKAAGGVQAPLTTDMKESLIYVLCRHPALLGICENFGFDTPSEKMKATSAGWLALAAMIQGKGYKIETDMKAAYNRVLEASK